MRASAIFIACGEAFVEKVKSDLGIKARHREVAEIDGTHTLREPTRAYALDSGIETEVLTLDNTFFWQENTEAIET